MSLPSSAPRVLLIGAHGKVALHMLPRLVALSWTVIGLIRNPAHKNTILAAGDYGPGKVEVCMTDLFDIKSEVAAKKVLDKVTPDYVIWTAGSDAGEQGSGPAQTLAIDRDACQYFIAAACHDPRITRFLLVSTINARNTPSPWWTPSNWQSILDSKKGMETYTIAKQAADAYFTAQARERIANDKREGRTPFQYIGLRPIWLGNGPAKGTADLGRSDVTRLAPVSREDVADVGVRLLMRADTMGWWDMTDGGMEIGEGVQKYVMEGPEGDNECESGEGGGL